MRAISLAKFEEGIINEDAAIAKKEVIAVSDGAGGGGVFADLWSKYLVEQLPDEPIVSYEAFDKWIDGIWESFYNDCEKKAKDIGGMFLNKFYDEGSFATLVAIWKDGQWVSYGDSVAFCYNPKTKEMKYTVKIEPENIKDTRFNLMQYYANYSNKDKKWIPEFVTEGTDILTVSSKYDIPLVLDDRETTIADFLADFGTPTSGIDAEISLKIKTFDDGKVAYYPQAVRIRMNAYDVPTYSMRNLFD